VKAKGLSLWAIVLGGVWVAAHSIIMAFWPRWNERPYGLSMKDILFSGAFLILSWSPVYGSVWIDKFLNRKLDDLINNKPAVPPVPMPETPGPYGQNYPGYS
jgi:hypothetical protein